MADNIGRMFVDNDLIMEHHILEGSIASNVVKKTIEGGVHRIKVDLYNTPQRETIVNNNTKDQKKKYL